MASMNRVILIGRLTADPELRHTPSGAPVANFTLAVDRKFSKNDETDFVPVVAWRKLAEICNDYLHKGKLVSIEGRLQTRTYQDKDGNNRKAFDVVADEMVMLSKGTDGQQQASSPPRKRQDPRASNPRFPPAEDDLGIDDIPVFPGFPPTEDNLGIDDIPF